MRKMNISSKSSARTREEVLARNPRAYGGPSNEKVEIRRAKRELACTADHTTKACIKARIEKLEHPNECCERCGKPEECCSCGEELWEESVA